MVGMGEAAVLDVIVDMLWDDGLGDNGAPKTVCTGENEPTRDKQKSKGGQGISLRS